MTPIFIISIRELYDRDPCRQQGIDTGFGILSHTIDNQTLAVSAMTFADVIPEEVHTVHGDGGDSETIRLGVVGEDGVRHV